MRATGYCNLSLVEIENEVLRERYAKLKKAASTLASECENSLRKTDNRALMFQAIQDIKTITR